MLVSVDTDSKRVSTVFVSTHVEAFRVPISFHFHLRGLFSISFWCSRPYRVLLRWATLYFVSFWISFWCTIWFCFILSVSKRWDKRNFYHSCTSFSKAGGLRVTDPCIVNILQCRLDSFPQLELGSWIVILYLLHCFTCWIKFKCDCMEIIF